mmetsp:Transcript_114695/g.319422  ORF Transcript_114695/g.319422 Transcript_114695/m.319422 type:complete len:167 (+) Transcript_114695:1-501(+)
MRPERPQEEEREEERELQGTEEPEESVPEEPEMVGLAKPDVRSAASCGGRGSAEASTEVLGDSVPQTISPGRHVHEEDRNALAQGEPIHEAEEALPGFRLLVRLGDDDERAEELEWQSPDELLGRLDAFMATVRLKPLFKEPLLKHAELMTQTGQRCHSIDVVDLL